MTKLKTKNKKTRDDDPPNYQAVNDKSTPKKLINPHPALPIFLDRLVRDTICLVGSAVAAQVLVADRATLFPIVCALLRQANSVFDGIGLRVRKGFIVCWEFRSYERSVRIWRPEG